MPESRREFRERLQRIIAAGPGYPWLEPVAKIIFGAMVVGGVLFAILLALRTL